MNFESWLAIPALIATFVVIVGSCPLTPFTWESAQRELIREWQCGNKGVSLRRRWYGWIIVHNMPQP